MTQDRTAERSIEMCTAYGCPLLGSMSTSTKGGDFLCFCHFGNEPGKWQDITYELRRLEWLATIVTELRRSALRPAAEQAALRQRIDHDCAMAGRNDLQGKSFRAYEEELKNLVKAVLDAKQGQQMEAELVDTEA